MARIHCDAAECRFVKGGLCTLDEIYISNHYLAGPVCASHRYRNESAGTETANGPVPKGMLVTFADGDTTHCDLDNLVLETRAQHAVKNRLRIRGWDRQSAETSNRIADMIQAIAKAKKRKGRRKEGEA